MAAESSSRMGQIAYFRERMEKGEIVDSREGSLSGDDWRVVVFGNEDSFAQRLRVAAGKIFKKTMDFLIDPNPSEPEG